MVEIRLRDIDPDTGNITQDILIATCETEKMAKFVYQTLLKYANDDSEPNRDIYIIEPSLIF